MNHPYGYPIAFALFSAGAFFLIVAYRELDQLLETRRQRRLDSRAKREIRKQFNQIIAAQDDGLERP